MAIFTLTDIKFGGKQLTGSGSSGQLVGGAYESNIYRYPEDLGDYNKGHYMVIHVNVQDKSQYDYDFTSDAPTIVSNRLKNGSPSLNTGVAKVIDTAMSNQKVAELKSTISDGFVSLAGGINNFISDFSPATGQILSGIGNSLSETAASVVKNYSDIRGIRTVQRTTDTIALYMPDTLNFTNQQGFSDLSIGKTPIAAGIAAAASAADSIARGQSAGTTAEAMARNLTPYMLGNVMNSAGDIGRSAFATMTGMVENPMLELLYTSPQFRTFRFDFMFYPRSEQEAQSVLKIINRLKFHQSPELKKEFYGYYLVPPSEFDIKFYCNGQINTNIPEISTCVLESIDVDYAPTGTFSAYEVPGKIKPSEGGTGMPVAIRLNLQFKETEIMTKSNYANNKGGSSDPLGDFIRGKIGQ